MWVHFNFPSSTDIYERVNGNFFHYILAEPIQSYTRIFFYDRTYTEINIHPRKVVFWFEINESGIEEFKELADSDTSGLEFTTEYELYLSSIIQAKEAGLSIL
jgi:hypothetical protein